jgi:hypothetical protein
VTHRFNENDVRAALADHQALTGDTSSLLTIDRYVSATNEGVTAYRIRGGLLDGFCAYGAAAAVHALTQYRRGWLAGRTQPLRSRKEGKAPLGE